MTSLELLACAVLISIAGFMSAAEIALFSLSRFQLRSMRERFRGGHRRIKRLLADPSGLLITVLVTNEMMNIGISTLVAQAVARRAMPPALGMPGWMVETIVATVIAAPIVLFLCEITPKVVGARANQLVAGVAVRPLTGMYLAFFPVRIALRKLLDTVARLSGGRRGAGDDAEGGGKPTILRESDFLLMIEEGHREGAIREGELELIRNVFEFDDTTVAAISTPLAQVRTIPATMNLREALAFVRANRYSRFPVTGASRREIVGFLYAKDLLRAKIQPELLATSVAEVMRRPVFVQPSFRLNALFRKLKQTRTHIAVVQRPETGEAVGIVTMSDVLDALFEDFFDDDDEGLPPRPATKGDAP